MEGWVLKKSTDLKWNRRYLRLVGQFAAYFDNAEVDSHCRGYLAITFASELKTIERSEYGLKLTTNNKTLYIRLENTEDFERWKYAFWTTIHALQQNQGTMTSSPPTMPHLQTISPDLQSVAVQSSSNMSSVIDQPVALEADALTEYRVSTIAGIVFTLQSRFQDPIRPIGIGAFGAVISSRDSTLNKVVAVKKLANIFADLIQTKRVCRELRCLLSFNHPRVIKLLDIPPIPPIDQSMSTGFYDLYFVTELMDTDLHGVITLSQSLSILHIKSFVFQILAALNYIHSTGVIHRDLKPANVLVNANCDIRICDFGLSRGSSSSSSSSSTPAIPSPKAKSRRGVKMEVQPIEVAQPVAVDEDNSDLTQYVVTRWYRAPEIMLMKKAYTTAIDVWSVGCIMGELLTRRPLFPGKDYMQQIRLILKFTGKSHRQALDFIDKEAARKFVESLDNCEPMDILRQYPELGPDGADLLQRLLILNPEHRITVGEALVHPFLAEVYDNSILTVADFKIDFTSIEKCPMECEHLRLTILREIAVLHPNECSLLICQGEAKLNWKNRSQQVEELTVELTVEHPLLSVGIPAGDDDAITSQSVGSLRRQVTSDQDDVGTLQRSDGAGDSTPSPGILKVGRVSGGSISLFQDKPAHMSPDTAGSSIRSKSTPSESDIIDALRASAVENGFELDDEYSHTQDVGLLSGATDDDADGAVVDITGGENARYFPGEESEPTGQTGRAMELSTSP